MAPAPRTRAQKLAAAAAARSRFLEGSMNDRASAAPPVAFLGPAERAALETPVPGDGAGGADAGDGHARLRLERLQQGRRAAGRTRLGLVWEGVRGRLRMRRESAGGDDGVVGGRKKSSSSSSSAPPLPPQQQQQRHAGDKQLSDGIDRPSREEVLASYHQLVSAGFFANHAVYSTRRPPPGGVAARPATAHEQRPRDQHRRGQSSEQPPQHPCSPPHLPPPSPPPPACPDRHPPLPPQWPLTPKPPLTTPASPVCSPASLASSRGTKRPAADDDQDDDVDSARSPPAQHGDDDASALAHRLLPKRLRRSASRDISLPRVRVPRRTSSAAALPTSRDPPRRLARLALPVNAPGSRSGMKASLAAASHDAAASPRRPSGPRNLRPRIVGGPLSVVPDDNRGIPSVPAIPAKFARAEDQENDDGAAAEPQP